VHSSYRGFACNLVNRQFNFLHKIILRRILCKKPAALNFLKQKSLFNAAGNAAWFKIYAVNPFFKGRGMKQFMQRVMKQAMNRGLIRRKMLLFHQYE
jgi:hypothetical protein